MNNHLLLLQTGLVALACYGAMMPVEGASQLVGVRFDEALPEAA